MGWQRWRAAADVWAKSVLVLVRCHARLSDPLRLRAPAATASRRRPLSLWCRAREEARRREVVLAPAVAKWLRGCGAADVAVGGISWRKVLQPGKKARGAGARAGGAGGAAGAGMLSAPAAEFGGASLA